MTQTNKALAPVRWPICCSSFCLKQANTTSKNKANLLLSKLTEKKKKERKKINAPRINVIKLSAHECSAGIETLKAGTRFYSNIKET